MSDAVIDVQPQPTTWRDAESVEEFLDEDPFFSRAIQAVVAVDRMRLLRRSRDGKDVMESFPAELCFAVMQAVSDYERAVRACRDSPKGATLDELACHERTTNDARRTMRYRANQLMLELGLSEWCDWEGFDSITGWKPGDYETDQVVATGMEADG